MTDEQQFQIKQLKHRLYELGYTRNSVVERLNNNLYKIDGIVYFIGDVDPIVLEKTLKHNPRRKLTPAEWDQIHEETKEALKDLVPEEGKW